MALRDAESLSIRLIAVRTESTDSGGSRGSLADSSPYRKQIVADSVMTQNRYWLRVWITDGLNQFRSISDPAIEMALHDGWVTEAVWNYNSSRYRLKQYIAPRHASTLSIGHEFECMFGTLMEPWIGSSSQVDYFLRVSEEDVLYFVENDGVDRGERAVRRERSWDHPALPATTIVAVDTYIFDSSAVLKRWVTRESLVDKGEIVVQTIEQDRSYIFDFAQVPPSDVTRIVSKFREVSSVSE